MARYAANPAVPDEMVDARGAVRPVWRDFVRLLEDMGPQAVNARFARGDQYLRDAGVFYRHYGKGEVALRDWPLSHIPVMIPEVEFNAIEAGLIQRAELLEAVAADLYGENKLVAQGDLPAALVGQNPHWLRPLVGLRPASGHFLHFMAMELGRGPDGRWWVLGDRTEAPSGAGFALENRVASGRVFTEFFQHANVHRLAGFFSAFRGALDALQQNGASRTGILTPGPYNDTYFEQAYIARYLGLPLLEGEDLEVQDDRLSIRTIEGPRPVSAIWRRLDSDWCDPLELNERSRLGVPGLLNCLRAGSATLVNALGTGVLETQAFLAFLPALCQRLRGEALLLPNVATWWCGQEAEYAHVRENAARMMISPEMSNRMAIEQERDCAVAGQLRGTNGVLLDDWISRERANLVGQELVTLSTTPAWENGTLVPRPVSVRFFLARTPEGWKVMPGGFARLGTQADPSAIAMGRGGSVADVWVVSDKPVARITLLGTQPDGFRRSAPAVLTSRAADNLFWLGRYVERAEGYLRLLRAYHGRLAEFGDTQAPVLLEMDALFERYGLELDAPLPAAVNDTLDSAMASASRVRDRFSMDGWAALSDLATSARQMSASVTPGDDAARAFSVLIRKLTGFSGLIHENMYHHAGWRFLSLGRALERVIGVCEMLAELTREDAAEGALDLAIEVGDSVMSHRSLHTVATRRDSVIDLLALDFLNPRAARHQIDRVFEHAQLLPGYKTNGQLCALGRAVLKVRTELATTAPEAIDPAWLLALRAKAAEISDLITTTYLS